MNTYILTISFLMMSVMVLGQKDKVKNQPNHDDRALHFGFNVGLNTMDFRFKYPESLPLDTPATGFNVVSDIYQLQPGFHVSIVSNLRLGKYFDLRFLPGISFGQRDIEFLINSTPVKKKEFSPQEISSSFLEFPLLLKYKAKRINNFRPYLIGGGNMRVDMAAKKDYDDQSEIYIRLKPFDFYYEVGFGFDSYLKYFKLSTELKLSVGLTNVLVNDRNNSYPIFVDSIDKLFSRVVMLSFYFE